MLNRSEQGCLVIADVSGYTGYLAGTELDHAQDLLADLIGTVVGAFQPVLRLAKLEGDAAFAYAPSDRVDGTMLLDTIEGRYFAFRRRLRDIRHATTCQCNACRMIPLLDLKFLAHDGTFIRQRIAGREELAGPDVILVHRLLKNSVTEALGVRGYAVFTPACVATIGIDPLSLGMRQHSETYEHMGNVTGYVQDPERRWREEQEHRRVVVEPGDAVLVIDFAFPAPPPVVWEYLTVELEPAAMGRGCSGACSVSEAGPSARSGRRWLRCSSRPIARGRRGWRHSWPRRRRGAPGMPKEQRIHHRDVAFACRCLALLNRKPPPGVETGLCD
ncbi:MAG: DUF2652 domain-containing protein [Armatimonadota bacterium]|nr:DUF2652 domain-containing protein [Armatimonadota bacterium]